MILWTIQPDDVYGLIQNKGVYRCNFRRTHMSYHKPQYSWLASQMRKRIGPPPKGVHYPVWAWYQWRPERRKPDLRWERWHCWPRGAKFYRLEAEIPDDKVLLHDFDEWIVIMNNGLLGDTEEESDELDKIYDSLSPEAQKEMRAKNWERVFNITPINNDWMTRGENIQATFWELRKEQIRKATMFISTINEGKI